MTFCVIATTLQVGKAEITKSRHRGAGEYVSGVAGSTPAAQNISFLSVWPRNFSTPRAAAIRAREVAVISPLADGSSIASTPSTSGSALCMQWRPFHGALCAYFDKRHSTTGGWNVRCPSPSPPKLTHARQDRMQRVGCLYPLGRNDPQARGGDRGDATELRQAGRPAGAAVDQVRIRHQPQDRQGGRARRCAGAASGRH
jgi:hypothetical protein